MNTAAERQKKARARKKAGALIQINMWISPEANRGLRQYAARRSLMLNAALNELLISGNTVPLLPNKSDQLKKIDQAKGKYPSGHHRLFAEVSIAEDCPGRAPQICAHKGIYGHKFKGSHGLETTRPLPASPAGAEAGDC